MENETAAEKKLIALGPETLATAMVQLARRHSSAGDMVDRLISSPEENLARYREQLATIHDYRPWPDTRGADYLAHALDEALETLRAAAPEPRLGMELVAELYRADRAVFESGTDEFFEEAYIFCHDAADLFVEYAAACSDKQWVCDVLLELIGDDGYGVRQVLADRAAEYLPHSLINRLKQERLPTNP